MAAPHATHPDHPDRIDLRSDTFTQPTDAMRRAMADASVGDDLFDEDPTVTKLEAIAAKRVGKDAALFVPSGTMGNLLAMLALTDGRGGEIVCDRLAHVVNYESGSLSRVALCQANTLEAPQGILTPGLIEDHVRPPFFVFPETRIITWENTIGDHGGTYATARHVAALTAFAREHGLATHCDGARLFHAAIAQDVEPAQLVADVDTTMFCLSKGLSAPVGSLLCGDETTIEKAHRYRKMLGGAMRQSGHLAAAGIVALDTMVERLAEDHAHAARIAQAAADAGFGCDPDAHPTNIVLLDTRPTGQSSDDIIAALAEHGVLALANGPHTVRFVAHRHITDDKAQRACEALVNVATTLRS